MTPDEGRKRGEKRAARGVKRAAHKHETEILRDMVRFLDALLASPTSCATTDDAVDNLNLKHIDGGRWRASVPKRLRAEGLIVAQRVLKSSRPARHGGYLTEWRLTDRNAAERRRAELLAALEASTGESAATDSPAVDSTVTPRSDSEKNHGSTA